MKIEDFASKSLRGEFSKLYNSLREDDNFIIFTHPHADGDCTGSGLALFHFLKDYYKKNVLLVTDSKEKFYAIYKKIVFAYEKSLEFYSEKKDERGSLYLEENLSFEDVSSFVLENENRRTDICCFLYIDASGLIRCEKCFSSEFFTSLVKNFSLDKINLKSLVIDHHQKGSLEIENDLSLVDATSPSAAELVYYVLKFIDDGKNYIDSWTSTCLFYALNCDTGSFRFIVSKENNSSFLIASDLVEKGAMPNLISSSINGGKERSVNSYFIALVETAKYIRGGKIVLVIDDLEFIKKYGIANRPSDEIYRFFLDTEGVQAVFFIKYSSNLKEVDVSIRVSALSDFDASSFSRQFQGGGHKAASGFHVQASPIEIENLIVKALSSFKV